MTESAIAEVCDSRVLLAESSAPVFLKKIKDKGDKQMKNNFLLLARSLTCVIGRVTFVFVCLTAGAGIAFGQQPAPAPKAASATDIDIKAIDALKSMGAYLRAA
jgi:hypothetical protein